MDKDPDPKLGPIQHVAYVTNGWRYHLSLLALLITLFITTVITLNHIQKQTAPVKARSQCLEIDRLFVDSTWQWNDETQLCQIANP